MYDSLESDDNEKEYEENHSILVNITSIVKKKNGKEMNKEEYFFSLFQNTIKSISYDFSKIPSFELNSTILYLKEKAFNYLKKADSNMKKGENIIKIFKIYKKALDLLKILKLDYLLYEKIRKLKKGN